MAADRRHKNMKWRLPEGTPNDDGYRTHSWESIHAALFMDIRDELQELNRTLRCHRVLRGMDALHSIDRRLAKHMPHRPAKKRSAR